jgi:hypothetical protein
VFFLDIPLYRTCEKAIFNSNVLVDGFLAIDEDIIFPRPARRKFMGRLLLHSAIC